MKTEYLTFTLKVKIQYEAGDNKSRIAAIKEAKKLNSGSVSCCGTNYYHVEEGKRKLEVIKTVMA